MGAKQGTGRDTRVMLPVLACIYMMITELFLPWFSIPVLKYGKVPTVYSLWNINKCAENINLTAGPESKWRMDALTAAEMGKVMKYAHIMQILAGIFAVLLLGGAVYGYWKRKQSTWFLRPLFLSACILPCMGIWGTYLGNQMINEKMGRVGSFINYTIHSYLQLTAFPYAQLFLAIVLFFLVKRLMDTEKEYEAALYMERSVKADRKMGKRTMISIFLILLAIPAVIFFGIFFLNDRSESFIALCIIGLAMVPFGMVFEDRRPQARELLLIAVMAAIAVVGRVAFFMIPQFKPVTAIVIITGVSLGAEAGFLTGAVAGCVSNFFFGQGPWTPWQMFAFGIIGFLAGVIFRGKRKKLGENRILLCIYGGIATFVIYGMIMDTSSVLNFSGELNLKAFLAVFASGVPFNMIHGISTIVFLFVLSKPMIQKLSRIKKKYGIMEQ